MWRRSEQRSDGGGNSGLELFTASILHIVVAGAFDADHAGTVAAPLFLVRWDTVVRSGVAGTNCQDVDTR
jgi:hypothetical protein